MLKSLLCVCSTVAILSSCAGRSGEKAHTQKPNIILILADDMGYSDIGCLGSEISTPDIDAFNALTAPGHSAPCSTCLPVC